MSSAGTLEQLARIVGEALHPLSERFGEGSAALLFDDLGIRLPEAVLNQGALKAVMTSTASAAGQLGPALTDLASALAASNTPQIIVAGAKVIERIVETVHGIADIGLSLNQAVAGAGGLTAAQKNRIQTIASELPKRLLNLLLVDWIEAKAAAFVPALALTGILDDVPEPGDDSDSTAPPFANRALRLDEFGKLLSNPLQHFETTFGWGRNNFDGLELFRRIATYVGRTGLPATILKPPGQPAIFEAGLFRLAVDPTQAPPGLNLRLRRPATTDFSQHISLLAPWALVITTTGRFEAGVEAIISTSGDVSLRPPSGTASLGLRFGLEAGDGVKPFTLLGVAGGSRIEIKRFLATLGLDAKWDSGASRADGSPSIAVGVEGAKVVIDLGSGDGFISAITGGTKLETDLDVRGVWSPKGGLHMSGSGGIEIALPTHVSIGPIELQTTYIAARFGPDGSPSVELSGAFSTNLGPLQASVDRIGLLANATFPQNGGNLGPLNLDFAFKPPNGVGLSLDAGGFKGGGFLMFDFDKGEYAGALELDFQGMFSVKAIGIINTKMPDGSPGFSLLIVISAEFTPIQLSFGFTLNGVGGIIGLNRTLVVAALADGIRTNAIKSILFPENVIANITHIISDIKQFFPPQNDHFLIGPMAKLGWGTPPLVTLELGLLLDLPNPMFAIVGVLKAVLPNEELAILRLQVNFIGIVDFEHGYVFFRADLYDSRLLIYSITGSMAFLVSWGEQQTFALSVGGFHPDFRDFPSIPALPDGFRNMARIGISLLSDDNPRLKVESYFAVTSNTVQFGARVELYAEAAGFNVYGFLGYDVLFQFDPFHFIADLNGGIALREGTSVIAGISISAKLSGPNPWDARGDASLTILFFEISVGFHVTWGNPPPAIAPATEDLLKLLQGDLANTHNWRADLPPDNHLHVSLKKIEPAPGDETLVIHPAGVLTFSQRSMPLEDYLIEKFGNKKPLAENKFKLTNANSGGTMIPADYQNIREQFAPGNFTELSDSEKLSRKSFEALPSGFKLSATSDLLTTMPVTRPVEYELSYLRRKKSGLVFKIIIALAVRAYDRLVKGSAIRQSVLSLQQTRTSLNAPAQVGLPQESFALANTADLRSHSQNGPELFATQAEAYQRHRELITANPALAGQIQVVSHFELNPN